MVLLVVACALCSVAASAGTGGTSPGGSGGTLPVTRPGVLPGGKPEAPARPRRRRPSRPGPGASDVPRPYLRLYRAAGRRYGIDWRLLAAMGKNESDHGRSTAPGVTEGLNFALCCAGPMQICTVAACGNPWQSYAVDTGGDGIASPYDPADAIFTAAAIVLDLQRAFGRDPRLLLAAYNAGAGAVQRHQGVPPYAETQAYVRNGLRYMRLLAS
jgi:hypothetical protein